MTIQNKLYSKFILSCMVLLVASSLYSDNLNIITNYRKYGIQDIEKELDNKLTQREYWDEYLKGIDTTFGYFEACDNILACDKSKSTLCVYKRDANNSYRLTKKYSAYTGKIKGDKYKEGDLRTPIGAYDLVKKISKVDSFYGPMAFVTSYPNLYDKFRHRTGQGIWIHGLPIDQKRDTFTQGCIAIPNKSIEGLDKNIDISKTVLIIDKNIIDKNVTKANLSSVLANLFEWRYSWIYNDINTYLSFYAPEFKRFDGMDIDRFTKYKTRVFNKKEKKRIIFTNINIIPYPETTNVYKITFKEDYKSSSFSFIGNKILIAKLVNDKLTIITEQ